MKKFTDITHVNENKNRNQYFCLLVNNDNYNVNSFAIFENKLDIDHWLLNLANDNINETLKNKFPIYNADYWDNRILHINNNYFVVELNDAIYWLENYMNLKVYYIESDVIKNIKDKYNTAIAKKIKKYNI